jgi:hypothetical protein
MSQIRERRRSGVLTCYFPSEDEDTAKKPPPYPEWPELLDYEGYYTLPTIHANYQHNFEPQKALKESLNEPFEGQLVHFFPFLEPFKTQLFPKIVEYNQSHFGTELRGSTLDEVLSSPDFLRLLQQYGSKFLLDMNSKMLS